LENDPIYAYPIDALSQHYALENSSKYLLPSFYQIDFDDYPKIIYFHHEKKSKASTHSTSMSVTGWVDIKSIEIAFSHFDHDGFVKKQVSLFYFRNSFSRHGSGSLVYLSVIYSYPILE
jgi:hypothetical protein